MLNVIKANTTLTSVDLAYNALDGRTAQRFTNALVAAPLVMLELRGNCLGSEAYRIFSGSGELSKLKYLNLAENGIDAGAATRLAAEAKAAALEELVLDNNTLGLGTIWSMAARRACVCGAIQC